MYKLLIKDRNNEYQVLSIAGEGGLILEANNPLEYEFGLSNKTYSITLRNTDNNNDLLDNLFTKTFDYKVKFNDVFLGIEDNLWINGYLLITEFDEIIAKAQFVSSNYNIINTLKNKRLTEYNYLIDHEINRANQISSEALTLESGNIIYDLIDRGKSQYHLNSPERMPDMFQNRIAVSERFPAFRVKKIIDTILSGLTIKGNHFSETLFSEDQYLLFSKENANITADPNDPNVTRNEFERRQSTDSAVAVYPLNEPGPLTVTMVTGLNMSQIVTDNNDMLDSANPPVTGYVKIKRSGIYNIELACTVQFSGELTPVFTSAMVYGRIFIQGGATIKRDEYPFPVVIPNAIIEREYYITTGNYLLEEGMEIRSEFVLTGEYTQTAFSNIKIQLMQKRTFERVMIKTGIGEKLQISGGGQFLPDITAADFLRYYLKEHCLELFLSIEKKEAVFLSGQKYASKVIDITDKIIEGTVSVSPNNIRNNILFKRKISDGLMATLNQSSNANKEYLFNTGGFNTDTFESEFSTSHEERMSRLGINGVNTLRIWSTFNFIRPEIPPMATNFGLRLVYLGGVETCSYILEAGASTVSTERTSFRRLTPIHATFNSHFNGDMFNVFHKQNINSKIYGHILECELDVNDDFVRALYYLEEDSDWRNEFAINLTGFTGLYKILRLTRRTDNVYKAKLYKIIK